MRKTITSKYGVTVNGRTHDPTGLFEKCDCQEKKETDIVPSVSVHLPDNADYQTSL